MRDDEIWCTSIVVYCTRAFVLLYARSTLSWDSRVVIRCFGRVCCMCVFLFFCCVCIFCVFFTNCTLFFFFFLSAADHGCIWWYWCSRTHVVLYVCYCIVCFTLELIFVVVVCVCLSYSLFFDRFLWFIFLFFVFLHFCVLGGFSSIVFFFAVSSHDWRSLV